MFAYICKMKRPELFSDKYKHYTIKKYFEL